MPRRASFAIAMTALLAAPAAAHADRTVGGEVQFKRQSCAGAKWEAVGGQPVVRYEQRGQKTEYAKLRPDGEFRRTMDGDGPITVTLVLTRRVAVYPRVRQSGPWEVELGELTRTDLRVRIRDFDETGALNIWATLQDGVAVADRMLGRRMPITYVHWEDGRNIAEKKDVKGNYYRRSQDSIYIDGEQADKRGDEYEPTIILHELGHHVLAGVKAPPDHGHDHFQSTVHPDTGTPWDEGFANAFAAIASGSDRLPYRCRDWMQFGSPFSPQPENPILAQWNEMAVGQATLNLASTLGRGDRIAGLGQVLKAVDAHPRPVKSLKDVRDALAREGMEGGTAGHRAITEMLAGLGIGWGVQLQVTLLAPSDDGTSAHNAVQLRLDGGWPGCVSNGHDTPRALAGESAPGAPMEFGGVAMEGGLPYTWQDECLVAGAAAEPSHEANISGAVLWLQYPYETGVAHVGRTYRVTARYTCQDHLEDEPEPEVRPRFTCLEARHAQLALLHGTRTVPLGVVMLERGRDRQLFEFTHDGVCRAHVDCRI